MSYASTAPWAAGVSHRRGRPPRGWEIAGIVLGFVFAWPLALAYLVWKFMGYPVPRDAKAFFERTFARLGDTGHGGQGFAPTGNLAFDEYRRAELARLEEERRRLDEEAQAFASFVEELKRAKDRQEFDAFMARRCGGAAA